jgi:hypothetical protein
MPEGCVVATDVRHVATIDYWAANAVLPVPTLKTRSGRDLRRASATQVNTSSSPNLTDLVPAPHYPISLSSEGPKKPNRVERVTRAIPETSALSLHFRQLPPVVFRWRMTATVPVPSDPDPQLVHLITLLACSVDFRNQVLDRIAAYLTHAASQRDAAVDEVMADHERHVLGPLYRLLAGMHEAHLLDGLTPRQTNARTAHWFSERLAEFLEP